jgi:hypothetical protein
MLELMNKLFVISAIAVLSTSSIAKAQGMRRNDINEQMRIIAAQLTPGEMHALAVYYGGQRAARTTQK